MASAKTANPIDPLASGQNPIGVPPLPRTPRHTFEAITPFAESYKSGLSTQLAGLPEKRDVLECLKHVNCSYLSSGKAPNLLQLKQHAQSLAVLIREMTISTLPALIDNAHLGLPGSRPFNENESYDWLNDLKEPYDTTEPHHVQPLTSVLNSVETSLATGNVRNKCPLQEIHDENPLVQPHPYAGHQALIQHANELLERLDHEYSARGGLLSIFPTSMKKEDREKAEKTLLGQMIFWVQNLVQRIHHLERLYANAMDILSKEAVVPTETLTALGTRGRKGREVVYPQDRFVLVNAGDDLWEFLNAEFERKEVIDTQIDKNYRDLGATGEAIWAQRGGREFAQGITCIDVYTRYYRLRNNPLKTVFVIPAYEIHPGTKVTREIEQQPTVVSVVKPVWPERLSVIETKHKEDMATLKTLRIESNINKAQIDSHEKANQILKTESDKLCAEKRKLKEDLEVTTSALKEPANATKLNTFEALGRANAARNEAATARAAYEVQIAETKQKLEEAKIKAAEMNQASLERDARFKEKEAEQKKRFDDERKQLDIEIENVARAGRETNKLFKKHWLKQFADSQILLKFLSDSESQKLLAKTEIPDSYKKAGEAAAKREFDSLAAGVKDEITPKKPRRSPSPPGSGGGGGGDGTGGGGGLDKAPKEANWRRRGSFGSDKSGWSNQGVEKGSPQNKFFTALGKTNQEPQPQAKISPTTSFHTRSSGWSPQTSDHGSPQNPIFGPLGQPSANKDPIEVTAQPGFKKDPVEGTAQKSPGSASSMKTFVGSPKSPRFPTSPKKVEFSHTEMGPMGRGSIGSGSSHQSYYDAETGLPPSKKAKSSGQSPELTQKSIAVSKGAVGSPPSAMKGGRGGGGGIGRGKVKAPNTVTWEGELSSGSENDGMGNDDEVDQFEHEAFSNDLQI